MFRRQKSDIAKVGAKAIQLSPTLYRTLYSQLIQSRTAEVPILRSRQQEQLPRRFPPFQVAMGTLRLAQRIRVLDPQFEFAACDHAEYCAGALHQLASRGGVMSQCRTRDIQRTLLRQRNQIERRHCAA